jgi:hypothetical protein
MIKYVGSVNKEERRFKDGFTDGYFFFKAMKHWKEVE